MLRLEPVLAEEMIVESLMVGYEMVISEAESEHDYDSVVDEELISEVESEED
jgi:hypothetical protein